MERIQSTVIQLAEAKRFLLDGRAPYLRLALILLDNAAELLMQRAVTSETAYSDMYSRMLHHHRDAPNREELEAHIVPPQQLAKLKRFFDEKALFLSRDRGRIAAPLARVLRHLHRYRNEVYHSDQLRPESIRPATLLLFDIDCELFTQLGQDSIVISSDGDYSYLARYGFRPGTSTDSVRERALTDLRSGLSLDAHSLTSALRDHLTNRLDRLDELLAFISRYSTKGSVDRTLSVVQYWDEDRSRKPHETPERYTGKYTATDLARWRQTTADLTTKSDDKLRMFSLFADLEDALEPLEALVDEVASSIDQAMELASDIARGK